MARKVLGTSYSTGHYEEIAECARVKHIVAGSAITSWWTKWPNRPPFPRKAPCFLFLLPKMFFRAHCDHDPEHHNTPSHRTGNQRRLYFMWNRKANIKKTSTYIFLYEAQVRPIFRCPTAHCNMSYVWKRSSGKKTKDVWHKISRLL